MDTRTSQEQPKVVILRELGFFERKHGRSWDSPTNPQRKQFMKDYVKNGGLFDAKRSERPNEACVGLKGWSVETTNVIILLLGVFF